MNKRLLNLRQLEFYSFKETILKARIIIYAGFCWYKQIIIKN